MKEIIIEAAFPHLPQSEVVGVLGYDRLRGQASYRFAYDKAWLQQHKNVVLSGDLMNVTGAQYNQGSIFAFLQDILPDRWGKRLIDKRERLLAAKQGRVPHEFTDFEYLMQLDDRTRMGGLRLRERDEYVGIQEDEMPVPPIARLREFIDIAHEFERQDAQGETMREDWLQNLYRQGSSLGGARPKANVIDTDGQLWIAKIPSVHDDYDIALWEHFAHRLAEKAGIHTATTRLLHIEGQRFHTLLSKRFDRLGEQRIHFASAMTLTALHDGDDANSGHGYLDIADAIIGATGFANPMEELQQLYRRVAFNICVGNHDDHFRNHGFLLTNRGWTFSPAYDLNPTNAMTQSLLISQHTNESSLKELLAAAEQYLLPKETANQIITEVCIAVKDWRKTATQCGINPSEQQRFAARIDNTIN